VTRSACINLFPTASPEAIMTIEKGASASSKAATAVQMVVFLVKSERPLFINYFLG